MPTPTPVNPTTDLAVDRLDPWKEDGNIVLTAQGKYFRVHRSILSAYSEVFKDMFDSCVHHEAEKEFIEQCPVIHLDDAATDVQMMLKAMYDRSYPFPYYERMPISIVAAFLHLGDKYAIPSLVKEAKGRLCSSIEPTSKDVTFMASPRCCNLFPGITDSDPHNFQIMNLLQEMDLKAPLPLAMYRCIIACPLTDVVDGYNFNGSFFSLSLANLRSFIHMKDALEKFRVRLAKSLHTVRICTNLDCRQNLHQLWSEDITAVAPLDSEASGWMRAFCYTCRVTLKASCKAAMDDVWNQLPAAFGFDSWADVAKSGDFPSLTIRTY